MTLPPAYGGGGVVAYSLEEVQTPDTWIDDKPIFRKTVSIGNLPTAAASPKVVAHGVTGIDTFLGFGKFSQATVGTTGLPLPFVSPGNLAAQVGLTRSGNNVNVSVGQDRDTLTGHFTMYYTKT